MALFRRSQEFSLKATATAPAQAAEGLKAKMGTRLFFIAAVAMAALTLAAHRFPLPPWVALNSEEFAFAAGSLSAISFFICLLFYGGWVLERDALHDLPLLFAAAITLLTPLCLLIRSPFLGSLVIVSLYYFLAVIISATVYRSHSDLNRFNRILFSAFLVLSALAAFLPRVAPALWPHRARL